MGVWVVSFLPSVVFAPHNLFLLLWAGMVIVGGLALALLCRDVDKAEAASRGFFCGIAPSAVVFALLMLGQPGLAGLNLGLLHALWPFLLASAVRLPESSVQIKTRRLRSFWLGAPGLRPSVGR
jgi:hypothetical protein